MTTATQRPVARLIAPNIARVPSSHYETNGIEYDVRLCVDGGLLCECPASFNHLKCHHQEKARKVFMATTTDIALRPVALSPMANLMPSKEDMDLVKQAAQMVFSGKVALPTELNSPEKVAAVMLYGLELGLRPMTAIRHLYIVNGRVSPSAEVMAALFMKADERNRLIVEKLEVKAGPNGAGIASGVCTIRLIRPARNIDERLTVDWEQIKRAGLARDNNLAYPEDRLRYHCTKRLCRAYAQDLINGLDDGPAITAMTVEDAPAPAIDEAALYNEGDEPAEGEYRDVDHETGEIHDAPKAEPPITPTPSQLQGISRLIDEIKSSWGATAPEFIALQKELAGKYGTEKLKDRSLLSYDEAAALLLYLRRKNGEPVDMPIEDEVPATAT